MKRLIPIECSQEGLSKNNHYRVILHLSVCFIADRLYVWKRRILRRYVRIKVALTDEFIIVYYPTALRRVQITPKTSTNITRYLYSGGPVRQVCT